MPTPAPSILDTIDHAIADHELSADAMRWTPEPPAAPLARMPRAAMPTPEQIEAARRELAAALNTAFARIGEQWKAMQQAMKSWPASELLRQAQARQEQERRESRSRMRSAYRAKRGRRW